MSTVQITLIYLTIAVLGISPFISAFLAKAAGWWLGCKVNEAGTDPCLRWGIDFGKVLYPMFVLMWMAMFTMSFAILFGIGFTVYLLM